MKRFRLQCSLNNSQRLFVRQEFLYLGLLSAAIKKKTLDKHNTYILICKV